MNCSPEEQRIRNSCINKRLPVYAFEFSDRKKADCFIHILEREQIPEADMRYMLRTMGGKVMMFDDGELHTSGPFLLPA